MLKNTSKLLMPLLILLLICSLDSDAQLLSVDTNFTRADTLRGMLTPLRTCYDVTYYDLNLKIDPDLKQIEGYNEIHYEVKDNFKEIQIDLFENMDIHRIMHGNDALDYRREHNAVFIQFAEEQPIGKKDFITVYYSGIPIEAKRPPWDGGFTWQRDDNGNHWIGVSCEGIGASLWWPNKDHLSDEPDSMMVTCTVPAELMFVGNGELVKTESPNDAEKTYSWFVSYPINNYNVTLNIADYASFTDEYISKDGSKLALQYYVLPQNLEIAKKHFEQVKPMMACFEEKLGKYPFWKDGFALVETPYLGMEHQSAIAYGNKYKTGYAGTDYSRIGLDFDYIIIHEAGHEWWGNNVSCKDIADLWIHEGFCTYSEALYVECMYDYETALKYVNAKKSSVGNKEPMIGVYHVNEEGSGDMYSKGMLFLNTIRHIIRDDALWHEILYEMQTKEFPLQTITTEDVLEFFNAKTGMDFTKLFDQYLFNPRIPELEFSISKISKKAYQVKYRWNTDVKGFEMPVRMTTAKKKYEWFTATNEWQQLTFRSKKPELFKVDTDRVYIEVLKN